MPQPVGDVGRYDALVILATIWSRFIRAMLFRLISLGQAASHSPWFVQLPKPSSSIWSTIFSTPSAALGPALGQQRQLRDPGRDEERGTGIRALGHAGPAADAGRGVRGQVGVLLPDRGGVGVPGAAGVDADEAAGLDDAVEGRAVDRTIEVDECGKVPCKPGTCWLVLWRNT